VVGIMGPNSRECMENMFEDDFSDDAFPYATSRILTCPSRDIRGTRVSFAGELGWEVYIPQAIAHESFVQKTRNMVMFEMGHAGLFCLESCRLEKGYLHWGHDIGSEDSPLQAGLMFAVKMDKPSGFTGLDALKLQQDHGIDRRLVLFEVEAEMPLLLHDEPVYRNGQWVGKSTSGGLGFRTGKALTFAYVKTAGLSDDDLYKQSYEIAIAGDRFEMQPLKIPPYDPAGTRMRG